MTDEPASRSRALCERELVLIDRVRRTERRAIAAQVVSVIGHLIGTPLNVIAGRAALIRRDTTPEGTAENVRRIEEQVERLAQRIRKLIEYLGTEQHEIELRSVAEVISDAITLTAPIATYRGVSFSAPAEEHRDPLDGMSALTVLTSLLSLAANVAPSGSVVVLSAASEPAYVRFRLIVPGLEAPEARIDRLEPPSERERASADTLQVLSLSAAMAQRYGGRVEVTSDGPGRSSIYFTCAIG
jgi:signal transduction histidine kinase